MKAKNRGFLRTFAAAVTAAAFLCLGCQAGAAKTPRKHTNAVSRSSAPRTDNRTAALVADARTGEVLYKEKAGEIRYPASLTKMMTLYLLFSELDKGRLRLDQSVTVSAHAASQAPSVIGLQAGGKVTVLELALGMIVKSGNDAAVAAAEAIAGSEGLCAARMNQVAESLGMRKTHFVNASGLHDPRQVTTAYELASLGIALKRDFPQYYHLFKRSEFTYNGKTFHSHNRVTENYPPADGLKTGFVNASGFNLVTSAEKNGRRLIGVVLGGNTGSSRDKRMIALLEQGFSGAFGGRTYASSNSESSRDKDTSGSRASGSETQRAPTATGGMTATRAGDSSVLAKMAEESAGLPASQDSLSGDPLAEEGGFAADSSDEAPEASRSRAGARKVQPAADKEIRRPANREKTKLHEIAEANEEQEAAFVGLLRKAQEEDAAEEASKNLKPADKKKAKDASDVAMADVDGEGDASGNKNTEEAPVPVRAKR